jgi:LysM repeat protein
MFRNFTANTPRSRAAALASLLTAALALLLAGCAGASQNGTATVTPARSGRLTPYLSPSPSLTSRPTSAITATFTPLPPTPTPMTHEVKQGEDLSGLALRYGIELAELIAANPTVNPRAMSIGTILVIPESKTPQPTGQATQQGPLQSPTPIGIQLGPLRCTRARDNGIWCFQGATNNQSFPIESLTGVIHLKGGNGKTVSQHAALPLDVLQPGALLPLAAYFTPESAAGLTDPILANSELDTALPYRDDGRYVSSRARNQKVFISPNGLSAEVTLDVSLEEEGQQAGRVWVAAIAYDAEDNIIGVRRWEKPDGDPLQSGERLPVTLNIYSNGGEIARVDLHTEARP